LSGDPKVHIDDENPKPEEKPAEETGFSEAFKATAAGEEVEKPEPDADASGDKNEDADKTASEAADDKSAAQPGSPSDPWAGLSPEQEAFFKSLQHSEQSQRGRVAALTRKLQDNPAQSAPAPSKSGKGDDDGQDSDESASDLDKRLKQATEDYPDAVGPLVEVIADIRKEIGKLSNRVEPIADENDTAMLTKAYADLETAHPDYRQYVGDKNFDAWVADQPANIQQMANSMDAREVSLTLTLFKAERQAAMAGSDAGHKPNNDANEKKRERQLDGSKHVPNKGAPAAAGVPNDYSSAFKARASELQS
jgi:hypothetical protein